MSAQACTTARPPRTAIAWATKDGLFCEIPCRDGPPYVTRFRLTVEGLTAALNILIEQPEAAPRPAVVSAHPRVRRPVPKFDEGERAKVHDILKSLKII